MSKRPVEADAEVLPDQVASRLLSRASELDAAQRAGAVVAELRAAATEAGISPAAFDAALSELHEQEARVPDVVQPRRRRPIWAVSAVIATLIAISAVFMAGRLFVSRTPAPVVAVAPTVEAAFQLNCLTPGEAAALIRPLLRLPTNSVVYSPEQAPRVLTIRATPAQLRDVRSLLAQNDGAGSSACATKPAPAVNR